MKAKNIDEVLVRLEQIITDSINSKSRAGYFAALYYKVTASVKEGIEKGRFDDGPRMEQLDVNFANRYLDAYDQWKNNQPISGPWKVAFETVAKRQPLVLQHLLLGMNAHINLDLGIATCETMAGKTLEDIHNDFDSINNVISSLTYQVIGELNRISPLLSLMGLHATNYNSIIIQFSIGIARDGAWVFAEDLHGKKGTDYQKCITDRDTSIANLAQSLIHANLLLKITLWIVHIFEWKKPARIIKALHEYKKASVKTAKVI